MKRLAGIAIVLFLVACEQEATLRLGAPAEEPAPTVAKAIAASLNAAGFAVSVSYFDPSSDIFTALAGGDLDIALVEEPWESSNDVTALLPLYPTVLHVLRPAAKSSSLPALLEGRIYAGVPGAVGRWLATVLAGDLGVTSTQLLDNPWSEVPDAYFVFGGLLGKDAIRQLQGFELLDLAVSANRGAESIVDAIALRYPNLRPFVLPPSVYPTLSREPIRTLAVTTFLAAGARLDDEAAYRITQQLVENSRPIRAAYPLAQATSIKDMDLDALAFPLHRGARRYLERNVPGYFERHIEAIALLTTLTLTAASGVVAWSRWRKRARKDRVDRYITAVLAVRAGLRSGAPRNVTAELDAIEAAVLELVVAEKIEVDAGLIAFLQLCGSVRAEVGHQVTSTHRTLGCA